MTAVCASSSDPCLRLRRLLRNRVSAQQARERKKSYVSNLENTNKEQTQRVCCPATLGEVDCG